MVDRVNDWRIQPWKSIHSLFFVTDMLDFDSSTAHCFQQKTAVFWIAGTNQSNAIMQSWSLASLTKFWNPRRPWLIWTEPTADLDPLIFVLLYYAARTKHIAYQIEYQVIGIVLERRINSRWSKFLSTQTVYLVTWENCWKIPLNEKWLILMKRHKSIPCGKGV